MAIYRLEAKIFSRENRGRSVVAAAAYRAGDKLFGEREGKTHDYTRRGKGVVETKILSPDGAPIWTQDAGLLWNHVEAGEKRKDAQLAREFILALPKELSKEEQFETALGWAKSELVAQGMIAHISLHNPMDGKNPHAHILCTMRKLEGDQFAAKKPREWNDVGLLVHWRESWAKAVNSSLEKAGRFERVDHRSLKDRGIDRIPQPKIGVATMAMKRKGLLPDPERFKLVRYIKSLNAVRPWARNIEKGQEIPQRGMGNSWWERSLIFAAKTREVVKHTVKDAWTTLINRKPSPSRNLTGPDIIPPRDKGPDLGR